MRFLQIGFLLLLGGLSLAAFLTSDRLASVEKASPSVGSCRAICAAPVLEELPYSNPTDVRQVSDIKGGV